MGVARAEGGIIVVKHITIFDQSYPREKQAEGLAISEAVLTGKCEKCPFLNKCERDRNFEFPIMAWCQKRKNQILESWEE